VGTASVGLSIGLEAAEAAPLSDGTMSGTEMGRLYEMLYDEQLREAGFVH